MPRDYKNIIGGASAAALGFIHGDYKGAKLGYDLYQKYHNMPSFHQQSMLSKGVNKKRKQAYKTVYLPLTPQSTGSRGRQQSLNPNRRRKLSGTYGRSASVSSSGKSRQRSVGSSKGTFGGNNNLNNATKYKKKGKIATRHRTAVRVPKKLSKQIRTVVQGIGSSGYRCRVYNDAMSLGVATALPSRNFIFGNTQVGGRGLFVNFSPQQIIDSASVMFGIKVPDIAYPPLTLNNFREQDDSVFDILSQSVTYRIKNLTQRHVKLTMTVMTPKNNTDEDVAGTIDAAINLDSGLGRWQGNAVPPTKDNLAFPWQESPTLKTYYKIESQLVKLDPGASTEFVVHGYTGIFNWKKSVKEDQTTITTHHKYSKNDTKVVVFDTVMDNIVTTAGDVIGSVGGYLKTIRNTGFGLVVDVKEQIRIKAPKIKPVTANGKIDYYENYYTSIGTTNRVLKTVDVDDEGAPIFEPQQG